MIGRAIETGRAVPLIVAAEDHYEAQQNVLKFHELYGNQINIIVVDNSGGFGDARVVKDYMAFLTQDNVKYEDEAEVVTRAIETYLAEPDTGKMKPEVQKTFEFGMNLLVPVQMETINQDWADWYGIRSL